MTVATRLAVVVATAVIIGWGWGCTAHEPLASIEARVDTKVRALLPDQEYDAYVGLRARARRESSYRDALLQLDGSLDRLARALTTTDRSAHPTGAASGSLRPASDPGVGGARANIEAVRTELQRTFGDLAHDGRQKLFAAGLAFGLGAYGGAGGSLQGVVGVGLELSFQQGSGPETLWTYSTFSRRAFPASLCESGAGVVLGPKVAGGMSVTWEALWYVDWVGGVRCPDDYLGGARGDSFAVAPELQFVTAFGLNVNAGSWQGVEGADCTYGACPATTATRATAARGVTYGLALDASLGFGGGGDVTLSVETSTSCVAPTNDTQVGFVPTGDTAGSLKYLQAGVDLGTDIITDLNLVGDLSKLTPAGMASALGAAAVAIVHGVYADDAAYDHGCGASASAGPPLVVTVETGATPDLDGVLALHAADGAARISSLAGGVPLPGDLGSIFATELDRVLGGDAVVWQRDAQELGDGAYAALPADVRVVFVVGANGTLAVGAYATHEPQHVTLALTNGGLTSANTATWGTPIPSGAEIVHPLLTLDPRANLLAEQAYHLYRDLGQRALIAGGPAVVCSSYGCSDGQVVPGFDRLRFRLYSGFDTDLVQLVSAVVMTQGDTRWSCGCAADGIAFADGPWASLDTALNGAWNPKAHDTDDGAGLRSLALAYATGATGCVTAASGGDNGNSGAVTLDGVTVAQFANCCAAAAYHSCSALPRQISLQLDNSWSTATSAARMVVIGDSPTWSQLTESPTGGLDGNPPPRAWTIKPGWND
jgi:hypothetical protein